MVENCPFQVEISFQLTQISMGIISGEIRVYKEKYCSEVVIVACKGRYF